MGPGSRLSHSSHMPRLRINDMYAQILRSSRGESGAANLQQKPARDPTPSVQLGVPLNVLSRNTLSNGGSPTR